MAEDAESPPEQAVSHETGSTENGDGDRVAYGLVEEAWELGAAWERVHDENHHGDGSLGMMEQDEDGTQTLHALRATLPAEDPEKEVLVSYLDSGASRSVCPTRHGDQFGMHSTRQSRSGTGFRTATNKRVANLGERVVSGLNEGGQHIDMRYCVANVQSALDSVSQICDTGAEVLFTRTGGEIRHANGVRVPFERRDNTYVRKTWVSKSPFTRPSTAS